MTPYLAPVVALLAAIPFVRSCDPPPPAPPPVTTLECYETVCEPLTAHVLPSGGVRIFDREGTMLWEIPAGSVTR